MRLLTVSNMSNKTNIRLQKQHKSHVLITHVLRSEDDYYTCQFSWIIRESPGYGTDLPYGSPYLPDKMIF